jgi:hypothetical protein
MATSKFKTHRMAVNFTKILHSKAFQNIPKFVFLVCKYAIVHSKKYFIYLGEHYIVGFYRRIDFYSTSSAAVDFSIPLRDRFYKPSISAENFTDKYSSLNFGEIYDPNCRQKFI